MQTIRALLCLENSRLFSLFAHKNATMTGKKQKKNVLPLQYCAFPFHVLSLVFYAAEQSFFFMKTVNNFTHTHTHLLLNWKPKIKCSYSTSFWSIWRKCIAAACQNRNVFPNICPRAHRHRGWFPSYSAHRITYTFYAFTTTWRTQLLWNLWSYVYQRVFMYCYLSKICVYTDGRFRETPTQLVHIRYLYIFTICLYRNIRERKLAQNRSEKKKCFDRTNNRYVKLYLYYRHRWYEHYKQQ